MRKQFPVPKGLRSKSFASRYAKLRRLRHQANRRDGEQKESKLIPSGEHVPIPDRNAPVRHGRPSFGHAVAIGGLLMLIFFLWLSQK